MWVRNHTSNVVMLQVLYHLGEFLFVGIVVCFVGFFLSILRFLSFFKCTSSLFCSEQVLEKGAVRIDIDL